MKLPDSQSGGVAAVSTGEEGRYFLNVVMVIVPQADNCCDLLGTSLE